jgi:hypothetical protein
LKRKGFTSAANALVEQISQKKKDILNKVEDKNPFIPKLIKTLAQVK